MIKSKKNPQRKRKDINPDDPFESNIKKCHKIDDQKALANYGSWLIERHGIHSKLDKKLHRQSGELLMNIGDEWNQVEEEKSALEYTRIPQHFDRYRGNPEWWQLPPGLHNKCSRRDELTYCYQKTKVQQNEIPVIPKVGLSEFIKNEKMLFPRTRNVYQKWQESTYRKAKVNQLSSLLQRIEPHKPDFKRLIVIGKNFPIENESRQVHVDQRRNSSLTTESTRKLSVYDSSLKCCLKINGVFFYENSQSLSTSRKFHVLFEYDIHNPHLQTQYIVFENVGRITLRISWKKFKKFRMFRDIVKNDNIDTFCFDKNMLILVPGQIYNFPIWFRTNKACTVVETWEINIVPKFWSDPVKVFFVLQAQTRIDDFMRKITSLKMSINQRVKRRIIKEILEDLTKKTDYQNYKQIDYAYYEPELFEAINMDDSIPFRKPKYQYNEEIIKKLKEFYDEVRRPHNSKSWNLNVWDLQVMARIKDLMDYAETRASEFSQYRRSIAPTERRSRNNSEIKLKSKTSLLLGDHPDLFVNKETRYGQLMKLLWKMAPPSISPNKERLKYFQVYSIFNAYFTFISVELHQIKPFSINQITKSEGSNENRHRLIFEYFDETQSLRTKRSLEEDMNAQPKAKVLQDVSLTDVHKVHKLYFAESSNLNKMEKGKKKPNQEQSKSLKGKPSQSSSNLSRGVEDIGLVNFDFDPFGDMPPFPSALTKRMSSTSKDTSIILNELEGTEGGEVDTLNIYVTVYFYLSQAVDAMVDTLESAKEFRVPHENIDQLKTCFKLFIDDDQKETEDNGSINPFIDKEERDYFEKILRTHLNEVTGQYLICAKTEPVGSDTTTLGADKKNPPVSISPSIFSNLKVIPDEIGYENRGVQTIQSEDRSVHQMSTVFRSSNVQPPENENLPSSKLDVFYNSDDELLQDCERQRKSSARVEVSENFKKPSQVESVSLIKEWNKKHGSEDDSVKN